MSIILTEEQRLVVQRAGAGGPIEVIVPGSNASYVLLKTDAFARLAAQADPHPTRDGSDELYLAETL